MEKLELDDDIQHLPDDNPINTKRSRTWMLLLYPDNADMAHVLNHVLPASDYDYAGRAHDMEGKLHHHVVLIFKDARRCSEVANHLGIEPRWLRAWDKKKKAFRYLCHRDNPDKYQYDTDGIYGPLTDDAVKACNDKDISESEEVAHIIEFIATYEGIIPFSVAIEYFAYHGLYSTFRRMGILAVRLIEEHNNAWSPSKDEH